MSELKDRPYAVYAGLSFTIVMAPNIEAARRQMLMEMRLERKPWLGRDWRIHPASAEEKARWVAMADNLRASQPTASTAKKPPKSVARLFD